MDVFKTLILSTPDTLNNISGILPVLNGGTGSSTASGARVNLLPSYSGNANKVLSINSGGTDVEWTSNGAGDVTGPGSSTDNAIARFDGTTGKIIQNSGATISDSGGISGTQINSSGAVIATGAGQFGDDVSITGDLAVTGTLTQTNTVTAPNGLYTVANLVSNTTGNAGGATQSIGLNISAFTAGANAISQHRALSAIALHSGSGLITTFYNSTGLALNSTGNVSNAVGVYTYLQFTNTGAVTGSYRGFEVAVPTASSTGDITGAIYGYRATNVGRASATTAYSFYAEDLTKGSGNAVGFYGNVASGTGKFNLYMGGSAQNYLAGETLIGSATDMGAYILQVTGNTRMAGTLDVTGLVRMTATLASSADNSNGTYSRWQHNGNNRLVVGTGNQIESGGASTDAGIGNENASGNLRFVIGPTAYASLSSTGLTVTGNLSCTGALSKGSGSFKIDHPLDSKKDTHYLVHSFLESPKADLIYRGKVKLVNGSANVNIDSVAGMTSGTFNALCRNVQCFTSNEGGWTAVRGGVSGDTLIIVAQDNTCTDEISWMVIGERKDKHIMETDWTDNDGHVIVEPAKA